MVRSRLRVSQESRYIWQPNEELPSKLILQKAPILIFRTGACSVWPMEHWSSMGCCSPIPWHCGDVSQALREQAAWNQCLPVARVWLTCSLCKRQRMVSPSGFHLRMFCLLVSRKRCLFGSTSEQVSAQAYEQEPQSCRPRVAATC